jgi:hypothetical protein
MNPTTENRIDRKFRELKARSQKAFVAYITAGDPTPQTTPDLVWALERAGADIVELGVPFSDPLADGIVNQLSAQRALEAGTTTPRIFEILQAVRAQSQIPIVLYIYFNLIYAFGIERFCQQAFQAGADGLLVLDLPPEESQGNDVGSRLGDGSLRRISLARRRHRHAGTCRHQHRQPDRPPAQIHEPAHLRRLRHLHAGTGAHRRAAGGRRRRRQRPRQPHRRVGRGQGPAAKARSLCPSPRPGHPLLSAAKNPAKSS